MSRITWRAGVCACASLALSACTTAASVAQELPASFEAVRDVPLPGDSSRFDYESLDPASHRLYIAHLGAGTVPVYDIASGTSVTNRVAPTPSSIRLQTR